MGPFGCIWPMQPRRWPRVFSVTKSALVAVGGDREAPSERDGAAFEVAPDGLARERQQALLIGLGEPGVARGHEFRQAARVNSARGVRECDGPVADHAVGLTDRHVTGVGVADDVSARRAQCLRGGNGGANRCLAARAGGEIPDAPGLGLCAGVAQAVLVHRRDGFQRPAVNRGRVARRGIVGQVRAGDDQRPAVAQDAGQRAAKALGERGIVRADHRRNDLRAREQALQEGKLHFDRVLALVRTGIGHALAARRQERLHEPAVHRDDSERRAQAAPGEHGHPARVQAGVVGAQQDDRVVGVAGSLVPCVGGNLPREDVAGMRRDQCHRPLPGRRDRVLRVRVERRAQGLRVVRVELPGDRRLANPLRRLARRVGGHTSGDQDEERGNGEPRSHPVLRWRPFAHQVHCRMQNAGSP